ncbi:MAG: L-2-hydroxyglutarate oxidase [Candidatus Poriferisodalaceae bacterium]|jgi:L-2-hydroxyglutarate oxidase|tara:strand:+ start:974 stop:2173 length:1200 start_codon:yes stop_codon:yes gene_type:complete
MNAQRFDVMIIGGGILGLATGYKYLLSHPGKSLALLEREPGPAHHQTGRNSGVLHSGIYYAPGSLKADMAVSGRSDMVEFCRANGIKYDLCGKLIVATQKVELERLRTLAARAERNNVRADLIGRDALQEIEPHCDGIEAIHVPETGIVSYSKVCEVLAKHILAAGGEIFYGTSVEGLNELANEVQVVSSMREFTAKLVINCAGLRSDKVAQLANADDGNKIVPFRGEYYELIKDRQHLVNGLIYPVPDPSFPFLGVHLTKMIDGSVHAGPNAVLALAREGYRWRDVNRNQVAEHISNRGLWALARKYWKTGAGEVWRSVSKKAFVAALQRLVPDIKTSDLEKSPAGVRAQAMDSRGALVDDFLITETRASIHVLNAPSPAATASLRIADEIVKKLDER